MDDEAPILCARCSAELTPGNGNFYQVNIQAISDPSPPALPDWDLITIRREMKRTIDELQDVSPREAMDQVFRRLTIHLCNQCYRGWIEDPAGCHDT
jgi:hypothetical protein